jgi:putative transposase
MNVAGAARPKNFSRLLLMRMIVKLAEAAEKSWRRLDGHNQLPKIILGVRFTERIEVVRSQAQAAAA